MAITKCHLGLQPLLVGANEMNRLFQQWNKPFTDDMVFMALVMCWALALCHP